MLGIDLYQEFNLVSDWHLVAASVRDVYIKLSDGGGPARVRGDAYVAGARAAGCQVGGYHYMEAGPSPEAQADVFAGELRRLRALDLAPALDIEENSIPPGVRVDYGRRFLLHLQSTLNISRVAVYSSASWFAALKPDTWGVPGLVDWVAAYGPNDAQEHSIVGYVGHVDAHQYTSTGHIPGITGLVDLDDITGDITEGGDMPLTSADTDAMIQALINFRVNGRNLWDSDFEILRQVLALAAQVTALSSALSAVTVNSNITTAELTTIVNDAVAHHLQITGTVAVTGDQAPTA